MQGAVASLQDALGFHDEAAARYAMARLEAERVARENPLAVANMTDINGLGDVMPWAAGALGQGLPSIATGFAGAIGGRVGLGAAARALPQAKFLANPTLNTAVGSTAAMFPMEMGESAMDMAADPAAMANTTPMSRLGLASLKGGVNAALESVVPTHIVGKAVASAPVAAGASAALARVGRRTGEGMLGEFATEGAQNITGDIAHGMANPAHEVDFKAALNAGAAGAVAGGGMGALGGGAEVLRQKVSGDPNKPITETLADKTVSAVHGATEALARGSAKAGGMVENWLDRKEYDGLTKSPEFQHLVSHPTDEEAGQNPEATEQYQQGKVQAAANFSNGILSRWKGLEAKGGEGSDIVDAAMKFQQAHQSGQNVVLAAQEFGDTLRTIHKLDSDTKKLNDMSPESGAKENAQTPDKNLPREKLKELFRKEFNKKYPVLSGEAGNLRGAEQYHAARDVGVNALFDFADLGFTLRAPKNGKLAPVEWPSRFEDALDKYSGTAVRSVANLLHGQGLLSDDKHKRGMQLADQLDKKVKFTTDFYNDLEEKLSPLGDDERRNGLGVEKIAHDLIREGLPEAKLSHYFGKNAVEVAHALSQYGDPNSPSGGQELGGELKKERLTEGAAADEEGEGTVTQARSSYDADMSTKDENFLDSFKSDSIKRHYGWDGEELKGEIKPMHGKFLERRRKSLEAIRAANPDYVGDIEHVGYVQALRDQQEAALQHEESGAYKRMTKAKREAALGKIKADVEQIALGKYGKQFGYTPDSSAKDRSRILKKIDKNYGVFRTEHNVNEDRITVDPRDIDTLLKADPRRDSEEATVTNGTIYLETRNKSKTKKAGEANKESQAHAVLVGQLLAHAAKADAQDVTDEHKGVRGNTAVRDRVLATLTGMIHAAPERFTGKIGFIRNAGEAVQWMKVSDARFPSNFTYLKDEKKPVTEREQTRIPGAEQVRDEDGKLTGAQTFMNHFETWTESFDLREFKTEGTAVQEALYDELDTFLESLEGPHDKEGLRALKTLEKQRDDMREAMFNSFRDTEGDRKEARGNRVVQEETGEPILASRPSSKRSLAEDGETEIIGSSEADVLHIGVAERKKMAQRVVTSSIKTVQRMLGQDVRAFIKGLDAHPLHTLLRMRDALAFVTSNDIAQAAKAKKFGWAEQYNKLTKAQLVRANTARNLINRQIIKLTNFSVEELVADEQARLAQELTRAEVQDAAKASVNKTESDKIAQELNNWLEAHAPFNGIAVEKNKDRPDMRSRMQKQNEKEALRLSRIPSEPANLDRTPDLDVQTEEGKLAQEVVKRGDIDAISLTGDNGLLRELGKGIGDMIKALHATRKTASSNLGKGGAMGVARYIRALNQHLDTLRAAVKNKTPLGLEDIFDRKHIGRLRVARTYIDRLLSLDPSPALKAKLEQRKELVTQAGKILSAMHSEHLTKRDEGVTLQVSSETYKTKEIEAKRKDFERRILAAMGKKASDYSTEQKRSVQMEELGEYGTMSAEEMASLTAYWDSAPQGDYEVDVQELESPALKELSWEEMNELDEDSGTEREDDGGETSESLHREFSNKENAQRTNDPVVNVYWGANDNKHLSNLADRPFTYGTDAAGQPRTYRSVEHAYQTLKSGTFNQAAYDSQARKYMGRQRTKTAGDWNIRLMEQLMLRSFKQNPAAAKALLATGNGQITHTQDTTIWREKFPEALMKVRDSLRAADEQSKADLLSKAQGLRGQSDEKPSGVAQPLDAEEADKLAKAHVQSMGKHVDLLLAESGLLGEKSGKPISGDYDETEKLIRLSLFAKDKLGVLRHEHMHAFFTWLRKNGSKEVQDTLERVAQNALVMGQLKNWLVTEKAAYAAATTDKEEAVAYLYQLWDKRDDKGQALLHLGPKVDTLFKKIKVFLKELFGLTEQHVKDAAEVEKIFQALKRGDFADNPDAMVQALEKKLAASELKNEQGNAIAKGVLDNKFLKEYIYSNWQVIKDTGNHQLIALSKMFHVAEGSKLEKGADGKTVQGSIDATKQEMNRRINFLTDIFSELYDGTLNKTTGKLEGGLGKEGVDTARKLLVEKTPIGAIADPAMKKFVKAYREHLEDMHKYAVAAGVKRLDPESHEWVELGHIGDHYFHVNWDTDAVISNPDKFREIMKREHMVPLEELVKDAELEREANKHTSKDAASRKAEGAITVDDILTAIMQHITNTNGQPDVQENTSNLGITPYAAAVNRRTLTFIKDYAPFDEFMNKDFAQTATNYAVQMVKRAEYVRKFGNGGEKIQDAMDRAYVEFLLGKDKVDEVAAASEKSKKDLISKYGYAETMDRHHALVMQTLLQKDTKELKADHVAREVRLRAARKAMLDAEELWQKWGASAKIGDMTYADLAEQKRYLVDLMTSEQQEIEDELSRREKEGDTTRTSAKGMRAIAEGMLEGTEDEKAKKIKEANAAMATPIKAIMAMEGTLGREISDVTRKVFQTVTAFENVNKLCFTLFSSFVDPMGITIRGSDANSVGHAFKAFTRGLRMVKESWMKQHNVDGMEELLKKMGVVEAGTYMDILGETYSSQFAGSTKLHKFNNKFFKLIGMEAWNRAMRIQAGAAAMDFIQRHLTEPNEHSVRYMEELGLDPAGKATYLKENALDTDNPAVQQAVMKWVDGAILNPNASHRSIQASDPHKLLIYHLKQFTYSFHNVILRRVGIEMEHGNYTPLLALAAYIPIMIATDAMKVMLLPGDEPAWMRSLGGALAHGVARAPIGGIPQLITDGLPFVGQGHPMSLFGPAAGQAADLLALPFSAHHTALNEGLGLLPAGAQLRKLSMPPPDADAGGAPTGTSALLGSVDHIITPVLNSKILTKGR